MARCGVPIWIGAEPTFTDPHSLDPLWLREVEGSEKEQRARKLLRALAPRLPGRASLMRARGRQYPGENAPRFSLGALFARFGKPLGAVDWLELDEELADAPVPSQDQAWLTVTPDPGVSSEHGPRARPRYVRPGVVRVRRGTRRWPLTDPVSLQRRGHRQRRRRSADAWRSNAGAEPVLRSSAAPAEASFRYLNRHPGLSYAFAPRLVGSASQGPRADEGVRERFDELPVALAWLSRRGHHASPEDLWTALAPLLVDAAGNSHRAEINIEKLYNPYLPGRGRLGLVELRSLRMPPRPERMVAIGALFRAVAARLATAPYDDPLADWGARLHEMFGLPFFINHGL